MSMKLSQKKTSVFVEQNGIRMDFHSSQSWSILNPIEQSILDKIHKVGKPLKEWGISIYRGALTGFNDAFIITKEKRDELIEADPRSAEIIRPILRGRDVRRYNYSYANLWLICTFPSRHYKIDDFPAVKKYLLSFGIERLEQTGKEHNINGEKIKSRKKTMNQWFETQDPISYWDDFSKQKIVWARLSRISKGDFDDFPRFALIPEGYCVLDSLCFFVGNDLDYLVQVLNSKYAAYYFFCNVAILDNGGMQMRQQYVENIPIPEKLMGEVTDDAINATFGFTSQEIDFMDAFLKKKQKEIET